MVICKSEIKISKNLGLGIRLHPVVFGTIKGQQFRLTQHIKWD
jgi:hypothetical protein